MDIITSAVVSGILYDMIKHKVALTAKNLKDRLKGWLVDDVVAESLEVKLKNLGLNDELSESAIDRRILGNQDLMVLLSKIEASPQTVINQYHSGTGDNVAGNKIVRS